jgi:hypothetical protein
MAEISGRQPLKEVKPLRRSSWPEERIANVQEGQVHSSKIDS